MTATSSSTSSKRQIQNALRRWKGSLPDDDRTLFKAFVKETLSRLRGPFLAHHPPSQVLTYLEEAFEFARVRHQDSFTVELRPREDKGVAVLTCMPDQPFIVDTLRLFLKSGKANYWGGFNLVFNATRDADGRMVSIGSDGGVAESLVMLEADAGGLLDDPEASTALLHTNLEHARAMVTDFRPITRMVERMAERCEVLADRSPVQADALMETNRFLKWLLRENFVFMGADDGVTKLGIQQLDGPYLGESTGEWPSPHDTGTVRVRKSHIESPIHRSGRIDEILVNIGDGGEETNSLYLRGMFTYRAVTQPSRNVPILRRVLANILDDQQSTPGSFRYKGIANVFDSLPTEFLFTASRTAIAEMVDLVFESEQQQEVGVTLLMTGADSAFCLVAMPKTQFGDALRRQLEQDIVQRMSASYCDHGIFVGRYDTVLLHYYLTGISRPKDDQIATLTDHIRQLATPWLAGLWSALAEAVGERRADRLADTYGRAFPPEFIHATSATRAVRDIEFLEDLSGAQNVLADLFSDDDGVKLRLYEANDIYLSDLLPVLDNFGLVVDSSFATTVTSRGGSLFLDTFTLAATPTLGHEQILEHADLLKDGLVATFAGSVQDDRLNGLVLGAGLTWQEVDILRGYSNYAKQLGINVSVARMQDILLSNPITCRRMVELFNARFDPDLKRSRNRAMTSAEEAVRDELRLIQSHDEHLIVSAMLNLITATLRTNAFRTDRDRHYLSFKFDCSKVKAMGPSRPMFEIYVHNVDVEGVHLRFGMVARGGLRWSDRNDYRTEILGLATTQLVKNTVIVPTGAKGGFILKNPHPDRGERRQQADRLYETFINGLLDVTDNTVEGDIVAPPRVVRHDQDDAYLVVAADKGTAHLSDTANKLSVGRGFWMGDGFASGGSNGYDHKKVGITAKGAWKLVRRHFAERGVDPYEDLFTAVGVGDMGGDVFGNGLLETDKVQLKAAFNHLHIFLDPTPDAAASFAERSRLFACQGGWDQYDSGVISEGGGVFDRRHKSVPLSPQAQEMLGIEATEAAPEEVIHRILQMEVDLLWNGGIGTYVKASTESHADADDRSNNAVRVDATQLRCKIVGEGGNLGMTQLGRIEADLCGVALNTDAIDNSGGVDMSDHEVNLKILLQRIVERGDLSVSERNTMLEEMTDEVADLVYANNDAHGRQLSRDVIRSKRDIWQFGRAIAFVERVFNRDRTLLHLPTDEELARRAEAGVGLTRPELAVLSAWVKMWVFSELMSANPKDLPGYELFLTNYFPERIREKYGEDINNHMLADEIAMTCATTRIVADAGAAFVPTVVEATGDPMIDVAHAFLKAQYLARTHLVREELEALRSQVSLSALYSAWIRVDAGARGVARYWLSARGRLPRDEEVAEMRGATSKVYELQASEVAKRNAGLVEELASAGITEDVAQRVLKSQYLNAALMIWVESRDTDTDFANIVVRHLAVARATRLQEVLDDLSTRPAAGQWDPIATGILYNRFHAILRAVVVATPPDPRCNTVDKLEPKLARGHLRGVREQVDRILDSVGADHSPTAAALLVLEERLAGAIRRLGN